VKKYFGGIPRQAAPPAVDITEPAHEKERRGNMDDPLARLPQMAAAYNVPAGNTPDFTRCNSGQRAFVRKKLALLPAPGP